MIGRADGFDYFCQIVCDTEQQFDLQLSSILDTFKIEQCHTYKLVMMKQLPHILQPTQELKGDIMYVPVNKQPTNDLEYEKNLLNQRYDEMVRSSRTITSKA
jgi:hypothetical protein